MIVKGSIWKILSCCWLLGLTNQGCGASHQLTRKGAQVLLFHHHVPQGCIKRGDIKLETSWGLWYGDLLRDRTERYARNVTAQRRATHILVTRTSATAHRFDLWGNIYTCESPTP